jgi:hypothetical protein
MSWQYSETPVGVFVRIDADMVVSMEQITAVDLKVRRTDDAAMRQYIDVYTTHGIFKCYDPYIGALKAAIADRTV